MSSAFMKNIELADSFSNLVWEQEMGNSSSPYLKMNWVEMFGAFNRCIESNQSCTQPAQTTVIPAPTGTGKTLSMEYYASQLDESVGVLIVTFLTDEADEIAKNINKWSENNKAESFHSKKRVNRSGLKDYQVLVITHNELQASVDRLNRLGEENRLNQLYAYQDGKRGLIIIDEAIDNVIATELKMKDVNALLSALESHQRVAGINEDVKEDIDGLNALMRVFAEAREVLEVPYDAEGPGLSSIGSPIQIASIRDRMLSDHSIVLEASQRLISDKAFYKSISTYDENTSAKLMSIIDSIGSIMTADWAYYYVDNYGDPQIRTARSTRLNDISCVVLDATSISNSYYDLQDNITICNLSDKVRNYTNTTIHTSTNWTTGKDLCTEDKAFQIIREIEDKHPFADGNVALFTHKELRNVIEEKHSDTIEQIKVRLGHFNALTGVNDYASCNVLYVFGLLHKPAPVYTDLHALSTRGLDCFNDDEDVKQERQSLEYTLMASDVVQMINRVSCRRVIDGKGNCPETDIYLTLPNNKSLTSIILGAIKAQMPGVVIEQDWEFNPQPSKRRGPRSKYDELVIDFLQNDTRVEISFSDVSKALDMKKGVVDSFRGRLRVQQDNDLFITTLFQNGVQIEKKGTGWVFIKN